MRTRLLPSLLVGVAVVVIGGIAAAQQPTPAKPKQDVELPEIGPMTEPVLKKQAAEVAVETDKEIDIANIVTSAAKGVTTVQEAPTIITIITAEEIRQRGWKTLGQALATIPGWLDVEAQGNQVEIPLVRGTTQAFLFMRDGVSMFDPVFNIATVSRITPLETIKRLEVTTGPGGVLWGANSYLGVINLITKDAEDVELLEFSAGYGEGAGDPRFFRAYGMFGKSLLKNKLKIFLHASFDTFQGPQYSGLQFYASAPAPQPPGTALYDDGRNLTSSNSAQSWMLNLDGKVTAGPFTFYFNLPFGDLYHSTNFSQTLIKNECAELVMPGMTCTKFLPNSDKTKWNFYDRYGILEFKTRFFKDKIGLNAKAYYINFNRDITPRVFPSTGALPGGLAFEIRKLYIQRIGGTVDVDITATTWMRILTGAEVFYESNTEGQAYFNSPSPDRLPIVCPLEADGSTYKPGCPVTFVGAGERSVLGIFAAAQVRPVRVLTLDAGLRYQQGFGKPGSSYGDQWLGSAAAVWQFAPNFHFKANWAMGFRPPVFNNTYGNGAAVNYAGNVKLETEKSQAFQAEVNTRLLRNVRKVRELQLRLDYSYTVLSNLITISGGRYANAGKRAIHSVELFGKLYLVGDHYFTFGYTFLTAKTSDVGELRSVPNHWFTLGVVFNLVKDTLDVNANLNVFGAYEDPNRVPSSPFTIPGDSTNAPIQGSQARYTDLSLDRLTPVALLQMGARLRVWKQKLAFSVQFFNMLNQKYFYPDIFNDLAPTTEFRPNPAPGFSFFASITFRQ